jgi:ATP-dependent exoDNAse (exonuclease V) beta subunit
VPLPADSPARRRILEDLDTTLIVEAAAGTGKTTMLVGRILELVRSGKASLKALVAVTFTEKAAGEMKLRLRSEIERARTKDGASDLERKRLDGALRELEAAHIGTIHGFCADLLRERPIEAEVDPLFDMAAEDDQARLFDEAFDTWFQDQLKAPPEGVARVLRRRSRDRDASGPRWALRGAGMALAETRDFSGRWRREPYDRRAAIDALLAQLASLGAFASRAQYEDDYLAKNLAEVERFTSELGRREAIRSQRARDYDGLEAELRDLASKKKGWTWTGGRRPYARDLPRADVLAKRDACKRQLDEVIARSEADLASCLREELRSLVDLYEALKARAGKLDFLDLLLKTRDLLQTDPNVRAELQARFTHVLVDEFQDTDPLQAEILMLLASSSPAESDPSRVVVKPGKLFVVGDPKQSIYRFRRAEVALYESIKRRLVGQGAEMVHLTTSFRSLPSIQAAVNEAFAPRMQGGEDGSQASYVALQPFREENEGTQPSVVALPVPRPYSDWGKVTAWRIDESLPDAVGAFVDFLIKKSGWKVTEQGRPGERVPIEARHVCLLFKRFSSFGEDKTRPYVRALEARSIPHVLMGGRSYHAREEVLAIRNALSAVEWPDDELSVFATLRGPFFALGDDALLAYRNGVGSLHPMRPVDVVSLDPPSREVQTALDILKALHKSRNRRPIADTIARLLDETRAHAGIAIWPTGEQALANLLRVMELARRFEAQGATSFRAFVVRLGEEAERGGAAEAPVVEEGTDGVRIMTVHKAKGLEFPVVILVDPTAPTSMDKPSRYVDPVSKLWAMPLAGCTPTELFEHKDEVKKRDDDEAVRIAYVAATRARELLVVPVVGDEEVAGWVDVLHPVVYPKPSERRRAGRGPGCPEPAQNAAGDSVLERPPRVERGAQDAVAPGLHRSKVGGVPVVWWDPVSLDLGKEHEVGLRQQKLLEADAEGKASEEGRRAHDAWKSERDALIARGKVESERVETVTERAARRGEAPGHPLSADAIAVEATSYAADAARPRGKRFGTLVHAVLAEADLAGDAASLARTAAQQARLVGASEEEARGAERAVKSALEHPLLVRAAACARRGECRREVPVMARAEDGVLVEGVVDLAFREDGAWTVVDYKTDAEMSGPATRYAAQVALYVDAIARATGEAARGVLLRV